VSARFGRFIIAGAVAAGLNIGSRIGFSLFVPFSVAIVLAYVVGMSAAYVLNRLFVFEPSGRSRREEYVRFGLVNLVAFIQVWAISEGLARYALPAIGFHWHAEFIAHSIGVAAPVFTSYVAHKHFSFAKSAAGAAGG
jgi:putative flippase GtrA